MKTDPRLDGMEIRFNGRTLRARVVLDRPSWVDDREKFAAFAKRLQAAARGPRMRMALVAGADHGDAGILIDLTVNTDEPETTLEERVAMALNREPLVRGSQAVLLLEELDPVAASMFWTGAMRAARDQVATERSSS